MNWPMPLYDAQHSSVAYGWMRTCSHRPQKEPHLRSVGRRRKARRCRSSRPCCPTRRQAGQGYSFPPGMVMPAARRSRSHPGLPCGTDRAPRCCRSDGFWFAIPTKSAIRKPSSAPTSPLSPRTSSLCTSADGRSKSRSPKLGLTSVSRHSANGPTKLSLEPCLSGCHPHPLNVGCTHSPEYSRSKVGAAVPLAMPISERNALKG